MARRLTGSPRAAGASPPRRAPSRRPPPGLDHLLCERLRPRLVPALRRPARRANMRRVRPVELARPRERRRLEPLDQLEIAGVLERRRHGVRQQLSEEPRLPEERPPRPGRALPIAPRPAL